MAFLKCAPAVYIVDDYYQIVFLTKKNGAAKIRVGEKEYTEELCGVLSTEKNYFKINVEKSALDLAKGYSVIYRKTVDRKPYFPILGDEEEKSFKFKPLLKSDGIKAFYTADVHYRFADLKNAVKTAAEKFDLYIFNGDIGELDTVKHIEEICKLVGDICRGARPVLFVRGNHDVRGRFAEYYPRYFPVSASGKTYFTFNAGGLSGLALDAGEDKLDCNKEYGGVNVFEPYRRVELNYLKSLTPIKNKYVFAVSHINFTCPSDVHDPLFEIESELYKQWNDEVERLGIKFMVCGHYHAFLNFEPNDKLSTVKQNYPVITASALDDTTLWATVIDFIGGKVKFTAVSDKGDKKTIAEVVAL